MKKIIAIAFSFAFFSCTTPGVDSPSSDGKVFLQVGSKTLQIHQVTINKGGSIIYILAPKDTAVHVFIENIGFTQGKTHTSVIRVE